MNLFFLVEGERTEVKVYKEWVKHTFPQLTFVNHIQEITKNCYCISSGGGYPKIFTDEPSPLEVCLTDLNNHNNIDHFFICVDSDDDDYQTRFQEVETELETLNIDIQASFKTHIFEKNRISIRI